MTAQLLLFARGVVGLGGLAVLLGLETWLPFFRGRERRIRHGAVNLVIAALNVAVVAVIFLRPLREAAHWATRSEFGLMQWFGLSGASAAVAGVVAFDLWMYAWHRANHRIHFLWRFHRMHHSETDLDVTTAVRFHTGEIGISSTLRCGVLALLGMSFPMLILYELALLPVIQFHHSNVRMPERLDRMLRTIIVSPNMHRVHHSVLRHEHDSNYGSIFSFWDRMFASYRWRRSLGGLKVGLRGFKEKRWLTLRGMLATPLR